MNLDFSTINRSSAVAVAWDLDLDRLTVLLVEEYNTGWELSVDTSPPVNKGKLVWWLVLERRIISDYLQLV